MYEKIYSKKNNNTEVRACVEFHSPIDIDSNLLYYNCHDNDLISLAHPRTV